MSIEDQINKYQKTNHYLVVASLFSFILALFFCFLFVYSDSAKLPAFQQLAIQILPNLIASFIIGVGVIVFGYLYFGGHEKEVSKFASVLEGYFHRVQPSVCFFREEGAKQAEGYEKFLSNVQFSIYMTHIDGDPPSKKTLDAYRLLLSKGCKINRLIFLQNPVSEARYGWIKDFRFPPGLTQHVIAPMPRLKSGQATSLATDKRVISSPVVPSENVTDEAFLQLFGSTLEQNADDEPVESSQSLQWRFQGYRRSTKSMMMSFAVVDHELDSALTAISILRQPSDDEEVNSFDDLLIVQGKKPAVAFYRMFEGMTKLAYAKELSCDEHFDSLIGCYYVKSKQ